MASNQTEHYQLPLWQPEDDFLRTEFNETHQLLDAALYQQATTPSYVPLLDITTSQASEQISVDLTGIDLTAWHEIKVRVSLPSHTEIVSLRVNSISDAVYYRSPIGGSLSSQTASDAFARMGWTGSNRMDVWFTLPLYMMEWDVTLQYGWINLYTTSQAWCENDFGRVHGLSWSQLETLDVLGTIPSGSHVQIWGVK